MLKKLLNITTMFYVVSTLVAFSMILLAVEYVAIYRNTQRLNAVTRQATIQLEQGQAALNNTNNITNLARIAVINADPKFEAMHKQALDIRDGKENRPGDYVNPYWDYLLADTTPEAQVGALYSEAVARDVQAGTREPLLSRLQKLGFPEAELAKLQESINASNDLAVVEKKAFDLAHSGNHEEALRVLFGPEYLKGKAKIIAPLHQFNLMLAARVAEEERIAAQAETSSQVRFIVTFVIALILMALAVTLNVIEQKRDMAQIRADHAEAERVNDELNNSVLNILQAVNQLSQRDLTARAPVTEDVIGTVSDSINALTEETARVLIGVTDIATQVSHVSDNVKARAEQVSHTAEAERQNVNQMMESLFEATQTMNQVAALAEQGNIATAEATEVTESAFESVTGTVRDMESIRETIAETEKRIKRLGERSQEISGIVNLINTIAERTHVLALNASMQAAVAGEAGRGFAVVAEEVQRLAESARNATEQIGTLVNNIQVETNETINTVNKTIQQVVVGSEQAQKAGEQMRRTQEITAQLVEQVRSIAGASEQQKAMSAQLLEAVQRIGESTEHTASQVEAQNQETDSLLNAARQLVDSVSVFKLPRVA